MKNKKLYVSLVFISLFALWTFIICFVDVKPLEPEESRVGLATLNGFFHSLTGVNMGLYTVTDWLGLVPFAFALSFATLGFFQLLKRKSLFKVDADILVLGVFYIAVAAAYVFFEIAVVNYRPVLINGVLEPSYPSSTTLLTLCVMPTAALQLKRRIKRLWLSRFASVFVYAFTVFMVLSRLVSGVHWLSDIIGGILISISLVTAYSFATEKAVEIRHKK